MIAAPARTAAATRRTRPGWRVSDFRLGKPRGPVRGFGALLRGMVSLGTESGSLAGAWASLPVGDALSAPRRPCVSVRRLQPPQ